MNWTHRHLGLAFAVIHVVGCQNNGGTDTVDNKTGDEDGEILLIDDCEDGDAENNLGGRWLSYDDYQDKAGGESEVWPKSWFKDGEFTMSEPGYGDNGYAARIKGTTADKLGWDFVGMISALGPKSFCPNPRPAAVDLNAYSGIRFMAKGKAVDGRLSLKLIHTKDGKEDNCKDNGLTGDTLTNWADYAADITSQLKEEWTEISLNFKKDFYGPDNIDIKTVLEHAKDLHFFFQSTSGGNIDLWIDDLRLYRSEESTDEDVADPSGELETFEDHDEDEAAEVFDRQQVREVRIFLPPKEWESLNEHAVDEQYTPASVTIMEETFNDVGLRFKGSYGSLYNCFDADGNRLCNKLSMKIKFNEYVKEQRFKGLKRINLHSLHNDNTKVRDALAYDVFRKMGIVAPRAAYADVYVNDEHLGLFGLVEQVDGRFTKSRFSKGDGNLYKEAWPDHSEVWYFDERLKTNREQIDHTAFMTFAKQMMNADDDRLVDVLGLWMDMDYLLRYMAVDFAIANWDGITTFYCGLSWACINHNYYMYQEEERPFFWLIPWDLEATFFLEHWLGPVAPWDDLDAKCEDIEMMPGETDMFIRPAGCDPMNRAIALADRTVYKKYLKEILEDHIEKEALLQKVNALTTLIAPYIQADPHLDAEMWLAEIESQLAEFDRVRARVSDQLE